MFVNGELVDIIAEHIIMGLRGERSETQIPARDLTPVNVGVSARHVHLNSQALEALYGSGYVLTKKTELMGGQFSCEECVTVVGANLRALENVRILGPLRGFTQVEVARTDAVRLGLRPPVRESGNIKGSAPISLIGPKGAVYLNEGCILAMRHIHMSDADAASFNVSDGARVSVLFKNERAGVLHDVLIRVDSGFTLEMHIDTDEGNALGVKTGDFGVIV